MRFDARPPRDDFRQTLIVVIAFAALALVVYWPSLLGGFLWDDDVLLTKNALVKAPDGLSRIWLTSEAPDYWPVTNASFWLEWRLWGMNPIGYHATNLLLHVTNACLIWRLLQRLAIPGALLAAAIFLVHPINVESVAWIAQRKNTLSLLFFLLSALSYMRRDRQPPGSKGTVDGWWYWLSFIAFVIAMLSKGSVVMLSAILLLLVWWRQNRIGKEDLRRIVPFVLAGAALTAVNIWFQHRDAIEPIRDVTWLQRLLGAPATIFFYLWKALVPINLRFVYPQWVIDPGQIAWWLPLLAAAAITAWLVSKREAPFWRPLLFAWAWYCLALVPVMGFTDVFFMKFSLVADHYQYAALIAVCAGVGAAVTRVMTRPVAQTGR